MVSRTGRVGVGCGVCVCDAETLQYSADVHQYLVYQCKPPATQDGNPILPCLYNRLLKGNISGILSASRIDTRRNIALPKMASTSYSSAHSRSPMSTAQMVPGTHAVDPRQHERHRSSVLRNLHGIASRQTSRCTSSSSDTMEQGAVPGKGVPNADDVELEPRPFPKVGDVVRYKGKWENDLSLGEVWQCPKYFSALRLKFVLASALPLLFLHRLVV